MRSRLLVLLVLIGMGVACGSSSSSSSTDSGSSGGSGSDDGTTDSSSGFAVSGTLSTLAIGSASVGKAATSGTATTVIAVTPETGNIACKTATIGSSGSFEVKIPAKKPSLLFFLDKQKKGKKMFLGRLFSSKLDAFTPTSATGSLKLGTVTIDASNGTASSETSYSDIVSGLGMTSAVADLLGDLDDLVRRYSNPDADEDGEIDCSASKNYMLDFHIRFDMVISGTRATVTNIIDSFLDESTTTASYTGTGIYVAYPTSFSSLDTGSATFVDSAVTTSEGGAIPKNTATSAVATNNFSSYYGFGPNTTSSSELPSGDIIFTIGSKTLTFADVKTPALSEVTAPTGRIFPFIKFTKNDASCAANCTIANVGYKWMKKTSSGWTAASTDELDLLVVSSGGNLSFRLNTDANSSQIVQIAIPKSSASGTIEWKAANVTLSGVTEAEFTNLITTNICHIGLSYDDQLGMRYFEGIANAGGTCP